MCTFNGLLYGIPVPVPSNYRLGTPLYRSSSSAYSDIAIDPTSSRLILLDYAYQGLSCVVSQFVLATGVYTVLSTMSEEIKGSTEAMAVDWQINIAYVASYHSSSIYAVDLTRTGQTLTEFNAIAQVSTSSISLYLVKTGTQTGNLYLASETTTQGFANTVLSYLPVSGNVQLTIDPYPLYASASWDWPDGIVVNTAQTVAYVMDGGFDHGSVPSAPPLSVAEIFQVNIAGLVTGRAPSPASLRATNVQVLYANTSTYFRGGMQLTTDQSTLVLVASTSMFQIVVNGTQQRSLVGPPVSQGRLFLLFWCARRVDRRRRWRHWLWWSDDVHPVVSHLPVPQLGYRYRPRAERQSDGRLCVHVQRSAVRHPRAGAVQLSSGHSSVPFFVVCLLGYRYRPYVLPSHPPRLRLPGLVLCGLSVRPRDGCVHCAVDDE